MPHFRTLTEISYELAKRVPAIYAQSGPLFFLADNEKEARLLLNLTRYWEPNFPDNVIISPYFQDLHTISPKEFTHQTLTLKRNESIPLSSIIKKLSNLGFEREPRAVSPRTFAVHGDVLDIVDYQPVRIEYDNDTISKISCLDISQQRATKPLPSITVWPQAYAEHLPLWHETDLTFEFITPKFYHQRFSLLKQDAQNYVRIQVATKSPEKVRALLPNATLSMPQRGLEGFVYVPDDLLFLTDDHIFGQEEMEESFEQSVNPQDLTPGDYVVHIDHGIALFDKIVTMQGEQFLELHYDKNDKLYVPFTKTNRVEPYVGPPHPKLTRLSGTQWETIVHKVQEDIRRTARELLDLQAQREVASTVSFKPKRNAEEVSIAEHVDFTLTPDQVQAIDDILSDLTQAKPMDRLLCGDVGFGKTEVALQAAVHVVLQGGQVAILAPTTILAQQHYENFIDRLQPFGIEVASLSRLTTAREQKDIVKRLSQGTVDIVIGTHRLLSSDIVIPKLELTVIDEEQRFGVKHKEKLKAIRQAAHVLTMTATPIPRTLHFAMSGLRDISVLNTAPANRLAISTVINEFDQKMEVTAIREELDRDGQVYLVHNNLSTIYARQSVLQRIFPTAKFAVAHGKLDAKTLVKIMHDFHLGKLDVLIASTIIENGLDIPNVNTLIVEQAEQFGLAQLYQLRGRVGRGDRQAYAYLLYRAQHLTPQAKERLKALHQIKELGGGFELAMKDLEIRGVGDMLGTKQHGHIQQIGLNLYTRLLNHAVQQLRAAAV